MTCGDGGVSLWTLDLDDGEDPLQLGGTGSARVARRPCRFGDAAQQEQFRSAMFVDVVCGVGTDRDNTYAVTSDGNLCAFGADGTMHSWVGMEARGALAITASEEFVAVGCAAGLVRMFKASSMIYIDTLPTLPTALLPTAPTAPPMGMGGEAASSWQQVPPHTLCVRCLVGPVGGQGAAAGGGAGGGVSGARPPVVRLATLYADRTLALWDIEDPSKPHRTHTFLNHSECIWDVKVMHGSGSGSGSGSETGQTGLPSGTIVTCSADETVRFWNLSSGAASGAAAEGASAGASAGAYGSTVHHPWTTDLMASVHIGDAGTGTAVSKGGGKNGSSNGNNKNGTNNSSASSPLDGSDNQTCNHLVDVEIQARPSDTTGFRSLAVSPDGAYVAAGDRCGQIRVYDVSSDPMVVGGEGGEGGEGRGMVRPRFRCVSSINAHNKEVLGLEYGPSSPVGSSSASSASSVSAAGGKKGGARRSPVRTAGVGSGAHRNTGTPSSSGSDSGGVALLASAGRDRLVHIYDVRRGHALKQTLADHSAPVTAVKFTSDGRKLLSSGGDRAIVLSHVSDQGEVSRYRSVSVRGRTQQCLL